MSYTSHNLSDTIVALATPAGVGAIGVIRLSGPDAISITDQVFESKNLCNRLLVKPRIGMNVTRHAEHFTGLPYKPHVY